MKREKSCGAVVFAREGEKLLVLIEQMRQGHYSIPKGHVEGAETETETAVREIREETGLCLVPDTGFRRTVQYSPGEGILKDVVFFVAVTDSMETRNQESEVSGILFLPLEEALARLTFASDRDVVRDAAGYLREKEAGRVRK